VSKGTDIEGLAGLLYQRWRKEQPTLVQNCLPNAFCRVPAKGQRYWRAEAQEVSDFLFPGQMVLDITPKERPE